MQAENKMMRSNRNESSTEFAAGVAYMTVVFANLYFVDADGKGDEGNAGQSWVLVDAGLPLAAARIRHAAEERYGQDARPSAIILTHGHFDHAGSALALAREWDVPVYAHKLELPYLTGVSHYPPPDPTVGGALAFLSRFMPYSGYDFGDRVKALPDDGSVPGLSHWRAIHTPGHTSGHVVLYREDDRVLLAGDSLATVNQESWLAMTTGKREFRHPPAPFTTDWEAARETVAKLASLRPNVVGAGHGVPMSGTDVADELQRFAEKFSPPSRGRYVARPARFDHNGVVSLPPPVADPLPKIAAGVALTALAGAAIIAILRRRAK